MKGTVTQFQDSYNLLMVGGGETLEEISDWTEDEIKEYNQGDKVRHQ